MRETETTVRRERPYSAYWRQVYAHETEKTVRCGYVILFGLAIASGALLCATSNSDFGLAAMSITAVLAVFLPFYFVWSQRCDRDFGLIAHVRATIPMWFYAVAAGFVCYGMTGHLSQNQFVAAGMALFIGTCWVALRMTDPLGRIDIIGKWRYNRRWGFH